MRAPKIANNPLKVNNAHGASTGTDVCVGSGVIGLITLILADATHKVALAPPDVGEHCVVVASGVAWAVLVSAPSAAPPESAVTCNLGTSTTPANRQIQGQTSFILLK